MVNPSKSYHLELITGHYSVSREVAALLREMDFRPGSLRRSGNYVLYFKHSEAIEDLLTLLGAPMAALELMNAKVEKEVLNGVNRKRTSWIPSVPSCGRRPGCGRSIRS